MFVKDIAEIVGGRASGNEDREITGAAPLESATESDLSFVSHSKSFEAALRSQAGCLIALPDYRAADHQCVIVSSQPRSAFAIVLGRLFPVTRPPSGVHPSAVVDESASVHPECSIGPNCTIGARSRIEQNVVIGAGCSIGSDVVIGPDSWLHPRTTIYDNVRIGCRAILHSGCVLGADGFGFAMVDGRYRKFPQVGRVELGDDVEIGANSCVDRAALGVTSIGDGVKLDNMVHIGHNCRIGKHVVIAAQTGLSGGVVVEDYAIIGGQVGIGDKARIETRAVLGSGSGVLTSKIIRSGQTVWGTPARPLKEYLQQLAVLSKLPELRADVAELKKKLE